MIQTIENWIDALNLAHASQRQLCSSFKDDFVGYVSPVFLQNVYFVTVDDIPRPDFPDLRRIGIDDFIGRPLKGIAYKNTYYIVKRFERDLRLHMHELVHAMQWALLGPQRFIMRYLMEIKQYGYRHAPMEKLASLIEGCYASNSGAVSVSQMVQSQL